MIAQDERIHDNVYLRRIGPLILREIVEHARWPDAFLRYEQVLRIGRDPGRFARFLNPYDLALVDTVHDLRRERPDISAEDIAYVLAIPLAAAQQLLQSDGVCSSDRVYDRLSVDTSTYHHFQRPDPGT